MKRWILRIFLGLRGPAAPGQGTEDPLMHPAILRMTERERADLPFDRGAR
jgi:hypothetical protein